MGFEVLPPPYAFKRKRGFRVAKPFGESPGQMLRELLWGALCLIVLLATSIGFAWIISSLAGGEGR